MRTLTLLFLVLVVTTTSACNKEKAQLQAESKDAIKRGDYYNAFLSLSKLCEAKEQGACDALPQISKDAYEQFIAKADRVCPRDPRECAVVILDSQSLAKYELSFNDYVANQASVIVDNCRSEQAQSVAQIAEALYCLGEADRPYDDVHASRVIAKRNILDAKLARLNETTPMRRYTLELMSECASGIPPRPDVTDEMIASLQSPYNVRFRTKAGDHNAKVCAALPGPIVICDPQGARVDVRLKKIKRDMKVERNTERIAYNDGMERKANPEFPAAKARVRSAERALVSLERRAASAKVECTQDKTRCPKYESLSNEVSASKSELQSAKAALRNTPEFNERQIIRHKNITTLDFTYTYRFSANVIVGGKKVITGKRVVEFVDRVVPAFRKGNIEGDPANPPTDNQAYDQASTDLAKEVSGVLLNTGLALANAKPCEDWGCTMRDRLLNDPKGLKVGPWPEWNVHDAVRCQPPRESSGS